MCQSFGDLLSNAIFCLVFYTRHNYVRLMSIILSNANINSEILLAPMSYMLIQEIEPLVKAPPLCSISGCPKTHWANWTWHFFLVSVIETHGTLFHSDSSTKFFAPIEWIFCWDFFGHWCQKSSVCLQHLGFLWSERRTVFSVIYSLIEGKVPQASCSVTQGS